MGNIKNTDAIQFTTLVQAHPQLTTLGELDSWCADAQGAIEQWENRKSALLLESGRLKQADESARLTRPWWKLFWQSGTEQNAELEMKRHTNKMQGELEAFWIVEDLLENTPRCERDVPGIVKKLQQQSKTLGINRQEVDLSIRKIASKAKQDLSRLQKSVKSADEKTAARLGIERHRDQEIGALERDAQKIERQIIDLERRIVFLESLI